MKVRGSLLPWLSLLLAAGLSAHALADVSESMSLEIWVIDQDGKPVGDVQTTIRSKERTENLTSNAEGRVVVAVSDGTYSFRFAHPGHYDLELPSVPVAIPAAELRAEPLEPLRVMMHHQIIFERDLDVIGLRFVAPPTIQVDFRPLLPTQGRLAKGRITISNTGTEDLRIPLDRQLRWIPDKTLQMRVLVEVEGLDMTLDEAFHCQPAAGDCHNLRPGEKVEFPVELQSRRSYSVGKKVPALWSHHGAFEASAKVYFVRPHGERERAIYTRPVEIVSQIEVLQED